MQRVCAVVVTFNRSELLAKTLTGLQGQTKPPDQIIVIDNASTDGTSDLLARKFPDVVVDRLGTNTGASGGFSIGLQVAFEQGFDWIWLLDDDVVPGPGCLLELLDVAVISGKKAVAPRRRATDGSFPSREAVINDEAQLYRAPESNERWTGIDIFTFEGPLIHRSVPEAIGFPNERFFIIGDDTEYSIRVYKAFGPLSSALANEATLNRMLDEASGIEVEATGWKHLISGKGSFILQPDENHWKYSYYLRNRHLIWKSLRWHRRRLKQILFHAGYVLVDLSESIRRGWNWRLRFKVNAKAFLLGLFGKDGKFIDPAEYRSDLKRWKNHKAA